MTIHAVAEVLPLHRPEPLRPLTNDRTARAAAGGERAARRARRRFHRLKIVFAQDPAPVPPRVGEDPVMAIDAIMIAPRTGLRWRRRCRDCHPSPYAHQCPRRSTLVSPGRPTAAGPQDISGASRANLRVRRGPPRASAGPRFRRYRRGSSWSPPATSRRNHDASKAAAIPSTVIVLLLCPPRARGSRLN